MVIFSIERITFSNEFHGKILNLILKKKKNLTKVDASRCLSIYREKKDSMYLCHEKYDLQQAVEIELSSRVMCKVLFFGSYCSHYTRCENFNFFPTPHNILLYFFRNLRYLIEVLKCFLDGIQLRNVLNFDSELTRLFFCIIIVTPL